MNKKPDSLNKRIPQSITKLLIVGVHNFNELAFELGKKNLYLQSMIPIEVSENVVMQPHIVTVRYFTREELNNFIDNSVYNVKRIFKHAIYTAKVKEKALLYSSAKNLLHIINGRTLRIDSKDKNLRQYFYEIAQEVNKKEKTNVKFDFDEYDVKIDLQQHVAPNGVFIILTINNIDSIVAED